MALSSAFHFATLLILFAGLSASLSATPKGFVTTKGDSFYLDGKRWIPFGTMYRPLSSQPGKGRERDWIAHYDAQEVERDLDVMGELGFNALRIATSTYYHADHQDENWATYPTPETSYKARINDFLDRAGRHGMKVQVFVHCNPKGGRWGVNLFDFVADKEKREQALDMVRKFIAECDLANRPEIWSYELDWEPHVGDETIRNGTRYPNYYTPLRLWNRWILDQYGSVEEAERCWGYLGMKIETPEGKLISAPSDDELFADGVWTRKSVAYRRFIEELVNKRYAMLRRAITKVDPNHLLMAQRVCFLGKVPHNKRLPYPVRHTCAFLDYYGYTFSPHETWGLWDPEVYRDDHGRFMKQGFGVRYNKTNKPVIFDEYGASTWYPQHTDDTKLLEEIQVLHYRRMFEVAERFGADGMLAWWWIGKRPMHDGDKEVSDWGILRPDRTRKPVFEEIKAWSKRIRALPEYDPDSEILLDEFAHADEADTYIEGKAHMLKALMGGKQPEVVTLDTGMNSKNCSLACICGLRTHDRCPKRALNAAFGPVEVSLGEGCQAVEYGETVKLVPGKAVRIRLVAGNTADARWLDQGSADGRASSVALCWRAGSCEGAVPLTSCVEPNAVAVFDFALPEDMAKPQEVVLRLSSLERCEFGDVFRFRIE